MMMKKKPMAKMDVILNQRVPSYSAGHEMMVATASSQRK